MQDTKVRIKKENLPHRCEVCHQSDAFDSLSNYCSRCTNTAQSIINHDESFLQPPLNKYISHSAEQHTSLSKYQFSKLLLCLATAITCTGLTTFIGFMLLMYALPIDFGKNFYDIGGIRIIMVAYVNWLDNLLGHLVKSLGIGALEFTFYFFLLLVPITLYTWRYLRRFKAQIKLT